VKGGSSMDIYGINANNSVLQQAISLRVMKMAVDTKKEGAEMLVQSMQETTQAMHQALNPFLGNNLDIYA